jgi:hypothetical protein
MSSMRWPTDIEELLGAYALDAVDDDERYAVDQYLATNPRARSEVQQHREVATLLSFSGAPAPDGLWDRIAGSLEDRPPRPGPELAKVLPLDRRRQTGRPGRAPSGRWLGALGGAAAATVIAVLGFLVVDQSREIDRLRPQAAENMLAEAYGQALADPLATRVQLVSEDGSARAQATIEPNGVGFLSATGLPELPADRTYQLWGVIDGKVISLGVLGNRPELLVFTADDGLSALVITEEERGGVPVSENPAALAGELS